MRKCLVGVGSHKVTYAGKWWKVHKDEKGGLGDINLIVSNGYYSRKWESVT